MIVPPREQAGNLDRVLVRLGAAEREERLLDVPGRSSAIFSRAAPLFVGHAA